MTVCRDIQDKLTAYLEGDLTAEEKSLVEAHLASCKVCKAALIDLKKTTDLVQSLEDVEPPPWLTRKIMTLVREEAEQKGSILQKLFYPLRIKIPIQAFATVLVVVLGIYVYKATGPEIKAVQAPPAAEETAPLAAPQKKPAKIDRRSPLPADKPVRQQSPEKETKAAPSRPIEEKALPTEQRITTKQETKTQKIEETPGATAPRRDEQISSSGQAAAPSMPFVKGKDSLGSVSSGMEESRKRLGAGAASPSKSVYAEKPAPIALSLLVKDVQLATAEVVRLAGRMGGTGTATKTTPSGVLLTTVLPAENFAAFLERLARLGTLKEKVPRTGLPEGNVFLHIEVSGAR
ncbi:MAG: hypothetical protein A4E63_01621 [Syntrophorhabdus sp. PtaU1.Bin050]|nr:MAG: hypothetical protein A4E63_01621 [Syntrophorhabdus sp. PtaU1.Bin050]